MKRTALLLALLLLVGGSVGAQTKKTSKTTIRTTHYTAQPTMMYFGVTGGVYNYSGTKDYEVYVGGVDTYATIEDCDYRYQGIILGVQGGYLYSLYGDINKSFSPYVGGEGAIGINPDEFGLVVQVGANVGVMLGKPTFRLDVRLQPQLTFFGDGDYRYNFNNPIYGYYDDDYEHGSIFRPNIAVRAGVWISQLNLYFQYNNIVSAGIGWRL